MLQQINLYSHFKHPTPIISFLNWKRFWISTAIFTIILFFIYIFLIWDLKSLHNKRIELSIKERALEKTFLAMKSIYPPFLFTTDAGVELAKLESELRIQQKILSTLSNPVLFSQHLITLANVIVSNVWLTSINITNGGNIVNLKGHSISNASLELFMTKMSKDPVYANYAISINNIQDNPENKSAGQVISFELNLSKKT